MGTLSVEAPEALPDYSISVRKATRWPPNCNLRRHQTHKELPVLASLGGVLFQFSEWLENSCPLFTYSAGALQINFNRQCASLVLQNSVAKLGGMIIRSGINWFSFEGSKVVLTQCFIKSKSIGGQIHLPLTPERLHNSYKLFKVLKFEFESFFALQQGTLVGVNFSF